MAEARFPDALRAALGIEEVSDQVKRKVGARKPWASGEVAKEMHLNFICLEFNLIVLMGGREQKS